MDDDLIKLRVADVRVAVPAGNGVEAGLVVLEEEQQPHRMLRMIIGQPEARAIHVSWSNTSPPRPSTWDLFVSTIAMLDGRIDRVIINDHQERRHFFAQVVVYRGQEEDPIYLTARPSDALALALRAYGADIYAMSAVLDEASVLADGSQWLKPEAAGDQEGGDSEGDEEASDADVPWYLRDGTPEDDRDPSHEPATEDESNEAGTSGPGGTADTHEPAASGDMSAVDDDPAGDDPAGDETEGEPEFWGHQPTTGGDHEDGTPP